MAINQELVDKKRKMEENAYVEYYKSLMRFSFKLVHRFNEFWKDILDEYGLNQTEFLILGIVADYPGFTQQEIVKIVGVDKSIVSRNLARLEKKNMVSRKPHSAYNHGFFCDTTDYGKKVYEEIHRKGDPMIEKRFSLVDLEELRAANDILMTIWEHIY